MNRKLTRFECFNHEQVCTISEIASLLLPMIAANSENGCVNRGDGLRTLNDYNALLISEWSFAFDALLHLVV